MSNNDQKNASPNEKKTKPVVSSETSSDEEDDYYDDLDWDYADSLEPTGRTGKAKGGKGKSNKGKPTPYSSKHVRQTVSRLSGK